MRKIKSGDNILVVVGRDKGKIGKVVKVITGVVKKKRVIKKLIVDNLNLVRHFVKTDPRKQRDGGIVAKEAAFDCSNVILLDEQKVRAGRICFLLDNGIKKRFSKKLKRFIL